MSTNPHRYDEASRSAVYRAIYERRDVRDFLPTPIEPAVLARVLGAAHAAPSVGLSQPWRFLRITSRALRAQIHKLVQQERLRTAEALADRRDEFLRLKVEGVRECAELLVVALLEGGTREVFGRRSMLDMDLASVACAIQNLWLAARAEGLGVGWVSMFDPRGLGALLGVPEGARPVAVLCVGHVREFDQQPRLALEHWREPRPLCELLYENRWPSAGAPVVVSGLPGNFRHRTRG